MNALIVVMFISLVILAVSYIRLAAIVHRWVAFQRENARILMRHIDGVKEIDYAAAMTMLAHLRDMHGIDTDKLPQPIPPEKAHDINP